MLRLVKSLCLIAAAGMPAGSAVAALEQHEACADVPAYDVPAQPPLESDLTAHSSGSSTALDLGMRDEAASAAHDANEVVALMQMHHVLAQEMTQGSPPAAGQPFAVRDALALLDSVTGLDQHLPARLRALVYDTDEPPALATWSVRWEAASGTSSLQTPWVTLPGELLAPLRAALAEVRSLLEAPSRPAGVAARPTPGPEPDSWAVLLAGVLGIGTIVRLRLLS